MNIDYSNTIHHLGNSTNKTPLHERSKDMQRKVMIGLGSLIALSLVVIAVTLIAPNVAASRMSGKTPFTAIPIENNQVSGTLAPGETAWHQFTFDEAEGTPARNVNMSLVFTPNEGGNQGQFIEFGLHNDQQLEQWYLGQDSQLTSLGESFVVIRDEDPKTGELFLSSELIPSETYYVRVTNDSDFTIYYTIFVDVEDVPEKLPIEAPMTSLPEAVAEPEAEAEEAVVSDLPAGIDPNNPVQVTLKPNEIRLEEGHIAAGTDHWLAMEVAEVNGDSNQPLELTLFVTPGDGNMVHKIHMDMFLDTYAHHWSVGNPDAVQNFGAGRIVERDGDPLTGELVWNGHFLTDQTYLVQLRNDNDFDVDFYLFTGDVINAELGEPAAPAPPVRVAPGADPNNALALEMGVNEGDLAPGDERWYSVKIVDFDGESDEHLQLTLYQTPNGGNNVHRVHMDVFNAGDTHIWSRGNTEDMPHFGSGAIVTRDHDEQTGTLFWDGWLVDGNEYRIRVRNSSDEIIHYWLFTDDIWNVELGERFN